MTELPKRKLLRLSHYDYSQNGAYFLTICAREKRPLFGQVVGGGVPDAPHMLLSGAGHIVEEQLLAITNHSPFLRLDCYVIMPNHLHLIVFVEGAPAGASGTPPPTRANQRIPQFVSTLKRFTNREAGAPLWQRGYHDHIIRSQRGYEQIWNYIQGNPYRWQEDCFYIKEVE